MWTKRLGKRSHICCRCLSDGAPATWKSLADAYQRRIEQAVDRWSNRTPTEDDVRWLDWMVQNDLMPNSVNASPKLQQLVGEYRAIESEIPASRVIEGLADKGPGTEFPVLIGGNAKTYGEPAPRRFLQDYFARACS